MFKGTKGPWYVDENGHYVRQESSDACLFSIMDGGHINPKFALPKREICANAVLASLGPDMLEALEECAGVLSDLPAASCEGTRVRAAWKKASGLIAALRVGGAI